MIQLNFLKHLALEAGVIIREGFNTLSKTNSEWKEDNTPVTAADIAVNNLVLERLSKEYPSISIISEEGSLEDPTADWLIYCDPIDGTFPYATGMAISTFCISALYKGIPMMAVIYDPFSERMYYAEKGQGAFLNNEPLTVSDHKKLGSKTHVHLLWWKGAQFDLAPLVIDLVKDGIPWMNYCSIAILGGLIAAGQFEASVFPGNKLWETAAMGLIVEEAGGKCTDIYGEPINYLNNNHMRGHLITNGWLHDQMLEMIGF